MTHLSLAPTHALNKSCKGSWLSTDQFIKAGFNEVLAEDKSGGKKRQGSRGREQMTY